MNDENRNRELRSSLTGAGDDEDNDKIFKTRCHEQDQNEGETTLLLSVGARPMRMKFSSLHLWQLV